MVKKEKHRLPLFSQMAKLYALEKLQFLLYVQEKL